MGPWIYVYSHDDRSKQDQEGDVRALVSEGMNILGESEDRKAATEAEYGASARTKSSVGLTRKVSGLPHDLERRIFTLARETGLSRESGCSSSNPGCR